ncbi:MAG: DNA cytosine methyltransferase [Rubrivivax sp.]|nr:MAG: DNA cytosine methyltransferase [Rubrivivax sp.]
MLTPQFVLGLADELVVDLFAGGGGASTGIEQAIGRHVDIAVNHDPEAVSLHQANHPQTRHFVSDVFEVDPATVTAGQPVGLLWASPDCKHFSKAKGGKPRSKKIRALAWVVIKWAKLARPRVICLENVEEFQTWGPLQADGMPCVRRKGNTFKMWLAQLRNLGYTVEYRELRACDYGAPTIRKRLFLVARCDGQPIVWPAATHAAKPTKGSGLMPYRTAADCIDWTLPCPSIFERERELAPATLRRIAHGIKRYVIDAATPFIARIGQTGHGDSGKVRSIREPVSTVTSKAEHLLVAPSLATIGYGERAGQAPRAQDACAPLGTVVGANKHAVVAAFLAKHYTGVVGSPLPEPIGTVTSVDHHSLVAAHVTKFRTGSTGSDLAEPLHTVTAGGEQARPGTGNAMGLVTAQLAKLRGTGRSANVAEPLHTISAQGEHHALVTSHMMTNTTGHPGAATDEPVRTVTTGGHHAEVRALLIKYYGSDQDPRLDEPLHTVTTKDRFGLVTVAGEDYVIADIGMRMLQPRELYRAQGFPDTYVIDRGADGRVLPKSSQVRMCGNSVCPPLARAIVAANFTDRATLRKAA